MSFSNPPIKDVRRCGGARCAGGGLLMWLAVCWLVGGSWLGCTAERRYRVMSFFFDGVPDPSAPPGLARSDEEEAGGKPVIRAAVFTHKPYADNQCDSCHVGSTGQFESFTKLTAEICLKCHQNVPNQYPVMHGPVATVQCTWCHVPHESSIKGLLKVASPAVCVQCHDRELLPANPPEHQMAQKSCLDCHNPHGGAKHGLLREGVALGAPPAATAPSTQGSTP